MYEELIGELYIVASGVQSKRRRELLEKAANAIEELIAKDTNVPSWIPVTERLPEKYTHNLVYSNETGIDILYFGRGIFLDYHADEIKGITHWMPLPEPPKEG